MQHRLAFAALAAALSFSSSAAFADAVVVMGEGPERACYLAAKTGLDLIAGWGHCNIALNNPLIAEDRVATRINRGVISHKMGRISSAMEDFDTALRLNPQHPDAYLNRGVAKITLGQYQDALADIQQGIDYKPTEMALAYFNRAVAYENLKQIPEAYADYQRALKEAPNFTAAANALSRFRVRPRA